MKHLTVFIILLSLAPAISWASTLHPHTTLIIQTQDHRALSFRVEVVDTPESLAKGLMLRRSLPKDYGMLFWFAETRPRNFWMKNTYLPLDILFLDEMGQITHIAHGTPLSLQLIPSQGPAKAAIEFLAGTVDTQNIRVGDQVHHVLFQNVKNDPN